MKRLNCFLFVGLLLLSMFSMSSCITSMVLLAAAKAETPNFTAAEEILASDVSNYADNIIEEYQFPDGKKGNVYLFNSVVDGVAWQNAQGRRFDPSCQEVSRQRIAEIQKEMGKDLVSLAFNPSYQKIIDQYKWAPNGPLTPYFEKASSILTEYGKEAYIQIIQSLSPISYFKLEDLGELSSFMTEKSIAQACYEDADGVYLLTIVSPEYLAQTKGNKKVQKEHRGEFGYECSFVPKTMYAKVEPPKLSPAKTTPINPNSIPDSGFDLEPVAATGNSPYYYDADLANQLQWLAVVVACKGEYDMAYTGDFSATNPVDNYTTSFIKKYLASNNGKASRGTPKFEGICFDYADWAYKELSANKSSYSNIAGFWMVGTFGDCNDIIRYRIAEYGEHSNMLINGTPVVVFNHNRIKAHSNATHHAWFWVQSTDGTVYWIDPTWTDNSGRPVYGIVRNGQEIELEPDSRFFAPQVK